MSSSHPAGYTAGVTRHCAPAGLAELIVLVDEKGTAVGQAEKWSSHHLQTPLHLAFSCYVFGRKGRFLATRRASDKRVWPGVWSNTVCGHPMPGETMEDAIRRRLWYELGMTVGDLQVALPAYRYRAPPFAGIVENEFCPVYLASASAGPQPNPEEVENFRWLSWPEFLSASRLDTNDTWSWWCKDQAEQLKHCEVLSRYTAEVEG